MAKKVETEENIENVFSGFKFLDQTEAQFKESKITPPKDDELSAEDIEALEKASKGEAGKPGSKTVSDENEEEDASGTEDDDKGKEKPKDTKGKKEEESNPIKDFATHMYDKGIFHLEDGEKLEEDEDLERVTLNTIKKGVDSYKQAIPEDGQKFLEFIENGGKPADFHKYYYGDSSFEEFNIDSAEDQEYVIREALLLEDYEEEDIKDQIELYKDTDKLASKAATHLKKLQKVEKENKKLLLDSQKEFAKQQETKRLKEWDEFKSGLMDKEAIGGFKLTPKSKNDLWEYMTKVVDKKEGKTAYQIDSDKNEDARYVFAYLLKNNWDVKSLERMVESKVVSGLKSKLNSFTDTRSKQKGASKMPEVENTDNKPFAGFSKMF